MPQTPPSLLFRHVRPGFLAALLLAWFWAQVITVSPELGITADEVIHVTGGHEYWTRGNYQLQPENGNLPQRLAALPLLLLRPASVPSDHPALARGNARGAGHIFFFHLGNQPGLMTWLGRFMISLVGVAAGGMVYLWSRSLWGPAGGLFSTAIYANSPTVLAHAGLATSDMTAAAAFLLATLTGWRLLHRLTPGRVLGFGVSLGILCISKFSAPLIVFVAMSMLVLRMTRRTPLPIRLPGWRARLRGWRRLAPLLLASAMAAAVALAIIWSAYGFRYLPDPAGRATIYPLHWDDLLGRRAYALHTPAPNGIEPTQVVPVRRDLVRAAAEWSLDHRLLPEAYVFGFLHVYTYSKWRPAFFLGDYRTTGWPGYFPVSVLLKTPVPLLALGLTAGVMLWRMHRHERRAGARWYRLAPLLCFAAIYGGFALAGNLNIGLRHLLPLEGVFAIGAGVLAGLAARPLLAGAACALLLAANVATWQSRPGYLAYFNSLAGGPDNAHAFLVDSSLDWGQGLPRLRHWLQEHQNGERAYLAYFGSDSPDYEGISALRIGDAYFNNEPIRFVIQLRAGLYVISATLYRGVYTMAPGPWTVAHETAYQARRVQLLHGSEEARGDEFWLEYDQLRFARLRHYLRTRIPVARPDPSLLVFRLKEEELRAALDGPVTGW